MLKRTKVGEWVEDGKKDLRPAKALWQKLLKAGLTLMLLTAAAGVVVGSLILVSYLNL